jgi:hypothetical protein
MYDELNAMVYKCLISPTRNEKIDNMIPFCECILFKYTKLQKYQPNEKFHNLLIQKIDDFMLELNSNDDENHSNKEYLLFLLSEITKEMHQNNEKIIEEKEELIGKNQELMIKIKEMIKEKKEKILKIDEKIAKLLITKNDGDFTLLCNISPLFKKCIDDLQQSNEQLTNEKPAEQEVVPLRRSERIRLKNVSNRLI